LRKYKVVDEIGLHARPLSVITNYVAQFDVPIHLVYGEKKAPLHSLMMAMSLGVPTQAEFSIEIDADNAAEIFTELEGIMRKEALID